MKTKTQKLIFLRAKINIIWAVLLILISCSPILSDPLEMPGTVRTETLKNGLRAIILHQQDTSLESIDIFVKAGSGMEKAGEDGAAHFLEHCLFKGTPKYKPGEIDETVETLGGTLNAATSRDYAHFYTTLPADNTLDALSALTDALRNSLLAPDEIEKERSVILDEMDIGKNDLHKVIFNHLFSLALAGHPYANPVLGHISSLQSLQRNIILEFYHRLYQPQNVTVILTGGLLTEAALDDVQQCFGDWASTKNAAEPTIPMNDTVPVTQTPLVIKQGDQAIGIGYRIPAIPHSSAPGGMKEQCMLDLLVELLGNSQQGMIQSELNRENLQVSSSVDCLDLQGPTLLCFYAKGPNDQLSPATHIMMSVISELKNMEVTPYELSNAKRAIQGELLYDFETVGDESRTIGMYEMLGDWRCLQTWSSDLASITPADIKDFAQSMLLSDNRTITSYGISSGSSGSSPSGEENRAPQLSPYTIRMAVEPAVSEAPLSSASISETPPSPPASKDISNTTLSDGVRVLIQPDIHTKYVALTALIKAGVAQERNLKGLGAITARTLFTSTIDMSEDEMNVNLYEAGGGMQTRFAGDYTELSCLTTPEHFNDAMYIIGEALKAANFDKDKISSACKAIASDLQANNSNIYIRALGALRSLIFTEGPYHYRDSDIVDSMKLIHRTDVVNYYRNAYLPKQTVISVYGNIDTAAALHDIKNQLLPDYDRSMPPHLYLPDNSITDSPSHLVMRIPSKTILILEGFAAPPIESPDYPAACVLSAIIGGGKGSRLFRQIRDEKGIGYSIGTILSQNLLNGQLTAHLEFAPTDKVTSTEAEQLINTVIQSVITNTPNNKELERARQFAAGEFLIDHQKLNKKAFYPALYELAGVGAAYDSSLPKIIRSVTLKQVIDLAMKILVNPSTVVVLPDDKRNSESVQRN
jgi:zinc protease